MALSTLEMNTLPSPISPVPPNPQWPLVPHRLHRQSRPSRSDSFQQIHRILRRSIALCPTGLLPLPATCITVVHAAQVRRGLPDIVQLVWPDNGLYSCHKNPPLKTVESQRSCRAPLLFILGQICFSGVCAVNLQYRFGCGAFARMLQRRAHVLSFLGRLLRLYPQRRAVLMSFLVAAIHKSAASRL